MSAHVATSLSVKGLEPRDHHPNGRHDNRGILRPPGIEELVSVSGKQPKSESLSIQVEDSQDGFVSGVLHLPPSFTSRTTMQTHHQTAAILLSGAGGGINGPNSLYLSLASKLSVLGVGIPTLRLDYRYPARTSYCVADVKTAMDYLSDMYGLTHFVLVGWSFGGAPVFTVGGEDPRVVGCATIASQTAETEGIRSLAPRPVLLLHGKGDKTLTYKCSEQLYANYGVMGKRVLKLFEEDDHTLSRNTHAAEALLCEFITECAGLGIKPNEEAIVEKELIGEEQRAKLMQKGGDLRYPESMH